MQTFKLKRGDTSPGLQYQLGVYEAGSGVLAAASVRFLMRRVGAAEPVVSEPATIHDADGIVRYAWAAADTAAAGEFEAEFEITYSDNSVETDPSSGFIKVEISGDIA